MKFNKQSIGTAVALALGTAGVINTASAVTFTFSNNATATNPGNTLAGFAANTEFHVATAYGTGLNGGDKDVMFGGEQWIFNGNSSGSLMTGVTNTSTNVGASNADATLTTGVAGFPVASTAGTVATIQKNASFVQTSTLFSMAAPLTGNIIGQTFGAAFIDDGTTTGFTTAGSFTITMPVVYNQWAEGTYIFGGDPNPNPVHGDKCQANGPCDGPGVVFSGTTDGAGNFTLSASYKPTLDEGSVAGAYSSQFVEWSLAGSYSTVVPVPAAAWLFGSGLMGLVGVARRRGKNT